MLKFECKCGNRSKCWNLREKGEIDQMLIFYCKSGNRSKFWNLIESKELIRILTLEHKKKLGIDQNVEIGVLIFKSIKMLKFE